jgi:hypothetical protein
MAPVISRAKVGHAGEEFTSLPDDLVEKIEAGELEDTWEIIEADDEPEHGDPEDGSPTPASGHSHGDVTHDHDTDFDTMSPRDLMALSADHGIEDIEGSGAKGQVLKGDVVRELETIHKEE